MTDANDSQLRSAGAQAPSPRDRRPTLGSRPGFWPTAALAATSFLLLFEFLAFQLSQGNDPALGSATATAPPEPRRPVLIRRVVNTRVIADRGPSSDTGTTVSSGGASSGVSPASGVPAAAPAPAPAAPVVSSSS